MCVTDSIIRLPPAEFVAVATRYCCFTFHSFILNHVKRVHALRLICFARRCTSLLKILLLLIGKLRIPDCFARRISGFLYSVLKVHFMEDEIGLASVWQCHVKQYLLPKNYIKISVLSDLIIVDTNCCCVIKIYSNLYLTLLLNYIAQQLNTRFSWSHLDTATAVQILTTH